MNHLSISPAGSSGASAQGSWFGAVQGGFQRRSGAVRDGTWAYFVGVGKSNWFEHGVDPMARAQSTVLWVASWSLEHTWGAPQSTAPRGMIPLPLGLGKCETLRVQIPHFFLWGGGTKIIH